MDDIEKSIEEALKNLGMDISEPEPEDKPAMEDLIPPENLTPAEPEPVMEEPEKPAEPVKEEPAEPEPAEEAEPASEPAETSQEAEKAPEPENVPEQEIRKSETVSAETKPSGEEIAVKVRGDEMVIMIPCNTIFNHIRNIGGQNFIVLPVAKPKEVDTLQALPIMVATDQPDTKPVRKAITKPAKPVEKPSIPVKAISSPELTKLLQRKEELDKAIRADSSNAVLKLERKQLRAEINRLQVSLYAE